MHNLEDFRDKFVETPKPVRPEDLPFPDDFLLRTYAIAALGLLAISITYLFHFGFPVVMNLFFVKTETDTIYYSTPIVLACIFFPVVIPMLYLSWKNKLTSNRMFSIAALYCFMMGTALAFASLGSVGLIVPLIVCTLTFAMMSGCAYLSKDFAQGQFATPITLVSGILFTFMVNTIAEASWVGWLLSIAAVIGPCYLGVNLEKLKTIAHLKNPTGLDEQTKSSMGGLTVLFNVSVFLFPYVRLFGKKFVAQRRWMSPEDK